MNIAFYSVLKEEESTTFQKNISIAIKKQLLDFIKLENIKSDRDEIRRSLFSFSQIYPEKEIFDFFIWLWKKGIDVAIEKTGHDLEKSYPERQLIDERVDSLVRGIDEMISGWLFDIIVKSRFYKLSSIDIIKYLFDLAEATVGIKAEAISRNAISEIMNISEYETYRLNKVKKVSWRVALEEKNEGNCLKNEMAGDIKLGNNFPSGHKYPPVGYYCSCYLMPYG